MMKINIIDKIRSLFCRNKTYEQEAYDNIQTQFNKITNQEIIQTKEKLDEEFHRLLKDCEAENELTLSLERSQEILNSLISLAVSRRKKLADDLKSHVESGNIFNYYNNQIKEIDALQTDVTAQLRYKKYLERDYEFEKSVYDKKLGQTYLSEYIPNKHDYESVKEEQNEIENELLKDISKGMEDAKK